MFFLDAKIIQSRDPRLRCGDSVFTEVSKLKSRVQLHHVRRSK
jgi:hypothetical protein